MAGIGVIIKAAGKVGGRLLGRFAGPVGAIVTIGELGYLGLKYSGTLENFKKLYCDRCRSEIPTKQIGEISTQYDMGGVFEVACSHCGREHALAKIPFLCPNCRPMKKEAPQDRSVVVPAGAKFLFFVCPQCSRGIRLAKNRYSQKETP